MGELLLIGVAVPFNMLVACRSWVEFAPEAGVDTDDRLFPTAVFTLDTRLDRALGLLTLLRLPPSLEGDSDSGVAPSP